MTSYSRMPRKLIGFALLVAADFCAILLCFFLAYLIRRDLMTVLWPSLTARPVDFSPFLDRFYMALIWIIVFSYEKLYVRRHTIWEETRYLLISTTISFILIMVAVFLTKQYLLYSRVIIFLAWAISLAAFPLVRYLAKRALIALGLWKKRVVIIGSIQGATSIIEAIRQNWMLGYEIVGCLTDEHPSPGQTILNVPVLGHYDDIDVWKARTGFEDIIVTFPNYPGEKLIALLKRWDAESETIRYIPPTGDLLTTGIEIENIGRVLSLVVRKNLHKPWNILLKTVFEFLLALVMIILLSPLLLVLALIIKADSRGPVFFRQERCGRKGKPIHIIKFRTMFPDGESRLEAHLRSDAAAREEWATFKKLKSRDPRVTRAGAFLRKFSLDELSQLVNVLRGEMSIVGPRPYLQEELEEVKLTKPLLFLVKPGITGLWQISGRSHLPFEERLRLDEYYIRNWSLWTDLVILIKTFRATITGHGAF
jgi:Undecaprenyl-phosphate galactose phosphotransferase WbaP